MVNFVVIKRSVTVVCQCKSVVLAVELMMKGKINDKTFLENRRAHFSGSLSHQYRESVARIKRMYNDISCWTYWEVAAKLIVEATNMRISLIAHKKC